LRFDYAQPEAAIAAGLESRAIEVPEAETLRAAARAMRRAIDVDAFAAVRGRAPEPRRKLTAVDG
jgi:hypothetical protein